MAIAVDEYEEMAAVNSEMRFMTLELMKIAAQQNKKFEQVLQEFTDNAFKLKHSLLRAETAPHKRHQHRH